MRKETIIDYFYHLAKHNRLCSSYLFVGDNLNLALDVSKLINCSFSDYFCDACDDCLRINTQTHPDLFIINFPKKMIKIEFIRQSQRFLYCKSFQAKIKVLIINYAHLLTLEAGNAFLKLLEEPPQNCLIILLSERTDLMLPTILSRCRKIYLPHIEKKVNIVYDDVIDFIRNKRIYVSDRESLSAFILQLITLMREYIVYRLLGDTKNLIDKDSCKILEFFPYRINEAQRILEEILKIYRAIDNININLACNLLSLSFS